MYLRVSGGRFAILTSKLPCTVQNRFLGQHLGDRTPLERLLGGQLHSRQEEVAPAVVPHDEVPDHVLAVAGHHATREVREVLEVDVLLDASTMFMSSGISECMVHGPFTAAIMGTSTASRFSIIIVAEPRLLVHRGYARGPLDVLQTGVSGSRGHRLAPEGVVGVAGAGVDHDLDVAVAAMSAKASDIRPADPQYHSKRPTVGVHP